MRSIREDHRKSIADGQSAYWRERKGLHYTRHELSRDRYRRGWANKILRKYGLTVHAFALMVKDMSCALCGRELDLNKSSAYAVDHDHKTGRTRGVVCGRCNYRHLAWVEEVGLDRLNRYLQP